MSAARVGSTDTAANDNRRLDPDFRLDDHGSVVVLTLMSSAAKDWREAHLPDDAMTWGTGVAIEPRYVPDIPSGIAEDGLTVVS